MIEPVDLGICGGYEYAGDPARTAIVLPGAMLAGMPVNAFAIEGVLSRGWRAILVWDRVPRPLAGRRAVGERPRSTRPSRTRARRSSSW